MTPTEIDEAKLKMQKTQLNLQIVSVLFSGILLYILITGKQKMRVVENPMDGYEFDILED